MATNGSYSQQDQYQTENEQCTADSNFTESKTANSVRQNLNKDEVGWCFVEQFYTTLGQEPERLHLFYGSNSQFVYGPEAEISPVSVGREAIQERFKELNFQEVKVRLSNVDSQASYDSIVIQVIGEISHSSAEPKKFVQSFVLAKQPTGYFVLNDIFRLINDDIEEDNVKSNPVDLAPTPPPVENIEIQQEELTVKEPSPETSKIEIVEKSSEIATEVEEPSNPELTTVNGASVSEVPETKVNESSATKPNEENLELDVPELNTQEESVEPEKSQDLSPPQTNSRSQYANKNPTPTQPAGLPKQLSWANRAAAAAAVGSTPKPAVPVVASKNTTQSQNRTTSSNMKSAQASISSPNVQHDKEKENAPMGSGWQTAGENPKKQNRPQSISALPEKECTLGYVRNVTDKVDSDELRAVLNSFGGLVYFDVNRYKNCAFVEYATPEGYLAAFNASPHTVSGEPIYVEPRRPKANAYGGNGYGGGRGGMNQRGRNNFANRGRGSGASPRGRGQANNT